MGFHLEFYLIMLVDTTQQTGTGPFSQGTSPICSVNVQESDKLEQLYHRTKSFIIYIPKYSLCLWRIFSIPFNALVTLNNQKSRDVNCFHTLFSFLLRTFHPQQAEHRCAKATSGHILRSRAIVAFHLIKRKYLKPSLPP